MRGDPLYTLETLVDLAKAPDDRLTHIISVQSTKDSNPPTPQGSLFRQCIVRKFKERSVRSSPPCTAQPRRNMQNFFIRN
jgi:hypothetical protein